MKFVLFPILLLSALFSFTQNQANNWYYQNGEGLNFSGGNPVLLTNGMIGAAEGTAAISDSAGNLLFYTEGVTIWDKTHSPMLNGTGLNGDFSTTQSAIIVPKPASNDQFFVFTLDQTCGPDGLQYSMVDMNLNGGNGGVISGQKNIHLLSPCLEKLAAVHHCNGKDVWVMAIHALTGQFYAWLVTDQGLCDCPVISQTGPGHSQGFGVMKFSNDGKRLVVVESDGTCNATGIHSDLYSFDNQTGAVMHVETIDTAIGSNSSSGGRFFGASFSPNNQLLYMSTGFSIYNGSAGISQGIAVVQYDLNAANIESSAVILFDNSLLAGGCGSPMGSMQLGPDGRIYVGNTCPNGQGMDVIELPDVPGLGCTFVHGGVPGAIGSGYGITNFIESYFGQGVSACDTVLSSNMCQWLTQQYCPITGDGEPEADMDKLLIYPNPMAEKTVLTFPNPLQDAFELDVYDIQGRLVYTDVIGAGESGVLERGEMKPGIYWVLLRVGNAVRFTEKLLVL